VGYQQSGILTPATVSGVLAVNEAFKETVETVSAVRTHLHTGLKPGVNEKLGGISFRFRLQTPVAKEEAKANGPLNHKKEPPLFRVVSCHFVDRSLFDCCGNRHKGWNCAKPGENETQPDT